MFTKGQQWSPEHTSTSKTPRKYHKEKINICFKNVHLLYGGHIYGQIHSIFKLDL